MEAAENGKRTGEVEDLSQTELEGTKMEGKERSVSEPELHVESGEKPAEEAVEALTVELGPEEGQKAGDGDDQDAEEDHEATSRDEKLKKLGTFCHSLGLQPTRLTDKMLNTIERSKDIERNQRSVISKLNSAASSGPQESGDEDEDEDDVGNPDDEDADVSVVQVDENNEVNNKKAKKSIELNSSSKSLRRKKIPPPLSIQNLVDESMSGNSTNSSANSRSNNFSVYPQSAPAHVPNFLRSTLQQSKFVGKPRVQYLGRVSNGVSRHQHNGYKLKTPFVPAFSRLPPQAMHLQQQPLSHQQQPPASGPQLSAHYPYFPYMYPMYQPPPYGLPVMAKSAIPYSPQARYYQDNESLKRRYKQDYNQLEKQTYDKKAKVTLEKSDGKLRENGDSRSGDNKISGHKSGENKSSDNHKQNSDRPVEEKNANGNHSDSADNTQIAIEDNTGAETLDQPSGPIMGEIRILANVFSFEFPVNGASIDKKMFLSICNSVWDKSEDMAKNGRQ
ncbi:hypothetical protein HG535_0C01360 [Zygotorulaspora mrakii]|uniref:Uncharacterized protein n=1 Tax=Zygotorulaspora mrakii TaxID=42260 RepID=A0A7H9B002_ZYGMR|nr:uncharacterized protein HG535_0C01360 [Zygotorulaspora mrakii]QLG71787.1 hypothetical protein HG535_0C01360 [Zygotorulaspora mrakii]